MSAAKLPPGIDRPKPGVLRVRYRDQAGKQCSRTFPDVRARKGEKSGLAQARQYLEQQRVAVRDGRHVSPTERRTVAQYAVRHIELNASLRDSSRNLLTGRLKHLDATGLGRQRIQAVSRRDVQAWVADRSAVLAPTTVRSMYSFVRGMFAEAVADNVINASPCQRISLPQVQDKEPILLTVAQVESLAAAMPERYRIGVLLQGALGLRVSEVLGLQRADIDLHRRMVQLRRQLDRNGTGYAPLKTKASRRTIPLSRPVATALGVHIAEHQQGPADPIVISPFGNPTTTKTYGRHFRAAVKAVPNIPAGTTPHALRDHAASLLVASGVPVNVVADFIGHKDGGALLLRVYAHLLPTAEDVLRNALDTAWTVSGENVSQAVSLAPAQEA